MSLAEPLTNWAGNFTFGARQVYRPTSIDELKRLVAGSDRIRAIGTVHSFSRVADSSGDLVSVMALPQTVDIDTDHSTVTVAAGVRYGDLALQLRKSGLAVHNLASLPHISVAGACATGTHGSGDGNGNLSTAVSAIELVTADGDLVEVRRDTDERFPGMVVALGELGVVTRVTLDVVPAFELRQYIYDDLPFDRVAGHLDEIFGNGYSVSLFTDWRGELVNQVWVKTRDELAGERWLGATPADAPRHPIDGMPVENCTRQLGVPGPSHERLPHFRLEFTPSSGEELQAEYLVARQDAAGALDAVYHLRERVAPVLQISEIRTIAADDLWLSPSYRRDSVAIHFTLIKDVDAVLPVIAEVEERLAPFAPRPHWGKLFGVEPEVLRGRYERAADFQRLTRHYDPTGKFRNDLLEAYFPRDW
jgi:xylitol oxidase